MKQELLDVLIIGAGLSGIGAAVHLQRQCPEKSFALLESRSAMGGTWDLFRYPGIRSDSDMFTLGYSFKPWTNPKAIADGASIRNYIHETAAEYGINHKIRYQHKVISADWSSRQARWTVTVRKSDSGESITLQSRFIICCAGYYKYDNGFTPTFAGREEFSGQIIHPQHWPAGFDHTGKRIVVIGSGATAVTLLPALAERAAHVTMLQRSPGYVVSLPEKDALSNGMRRILPSSLVYSLARTRNVLFQTGFYKLTRKYPTAMRKYLMNLVEKQVGTAVDMKHFTPKYNPWDERLCVIPDGDMFKVLREGRASIATDQIDRFIKNGVRLQSGEVLEADVIVTATGLEVQLLGGMQLTLDQQAVKVPEKLYYKGAMLEDVPNFAMVFGYTNSSWTLKADLIGEYVCRVLRYMDANGFSQCTPRHHDGNAVSEPFLNLSAGYIQRVVAQLPRQAGMEPWKMYQNYFQDYVMLRRGKVNDKALVFSNPVSHGYGYKSPSEPAQATASSPLVH